MTVEEIFSDILLGLAVFLVLASGLGVLVMRDPYQKLHFVSPASLVAPILVALAVLVYKGYCEDTTETWLALLFMLITGPFLSHATIRTARVREAGDWRPGQGGGSARGGGAGEE
ncbi:MAG: cation:proton antiporter [Acidimicrobiales bacterium]